MTRPRRQQPVNLSRGEAVKLQPFAIHDPSGRVVMQAVGIKRKGLRKAFADQMGIKWHNLWLKGYRLKLMERYK